MTTMRGYIGIRAMVGRGHGMISALIVQVRIEKVWEKTKNPGWSEIHHYIRVRGSKCFCNVKMLIIFSRIDFIF